jgi:hypothetical protein
MRPLCYKRRVTARIAFLLIALSACSAETSDDPHASDAGDPTALYQSVEAIVTQSCARDVCHGFMVANAHMDLMRDGFRAALVNVPSCEYDRMLRVRPGDPEHSWVMIKLAGAVRFRQYADFIDYQPDPDWHPSVQECSGSFDDGSPWFGTRMPPANTTMITTDDVEKIRAWIVAGAPGP